MPTAAGTYQWVAVYSGDANNSGVTSPFGSEPETVSPASPTINTTPGGSVTIGCGTKLTDSATLVGRLQPDRHDHLLPVRAGRDAQRQRTATTSTATRSRSTATAPTPRATGTNPGGYTPDGGGHLPVGGRLQRRHQQQRGHEPLRQRARDGDRRARSAQGSSRPSASGTTRTARPSSRASTAAPPLTALGNWLATQLPEPVRRLESVHRHEVSPG